MMLRDRCVAPNQVLLNDNAAAYGLDRTAEDRDEAIPCRFNQLPVMFYDAWFDKIALNPLDAVVCAFLIDLHEAAVAGDVACDNRSETTRPQLSRRVAASP